MVRKATGLDGRWPSTGRGGQESWKRYLRCCRASSASSECAAAAPAAVAPRASCTAPTPTTSPVRTAASVSGTSGRPTWSAGSRWREDYLALLDSLPNRGDAPQLGRSPSSVTQKRCQLGSCPARLTGATHPRKQCDRPGQLQAMLPPDDSGRPPSAPVCHSVASPVVRVRAPSPSGHGCGCGRRPPAPR